jgi:integrase
MASVYKHRKGWQACANVLGERIKKNFATEGAAKKWATATEAEMERGHKPSLGGPSKVTLAGMLVKYAHQFTNSKKGAKSELDRINRYLIAAKLPPLRQEPTDNGGLKLIELAVCEDDAPLPSAFQAHLEERRDKRAKTNALRAELACTLVSDITKDMLRRFMSQMHSDGLGGSTALKEMALLKHAFNMAIREWNWSSFKNPLLGMKLPTPAPPRDRVFASDEEQRLRKAMKECDNPFILPLFDFAIETTARRGSLFKLEWCDVDFERRYAMLYNTKGGHNVPVPLTLRAMEILKRLPRDPGQTKVFPITVSALKSAWNRACKRAGIDNLHFHDGRHIGTTQHAKRLRSPHMLMQITGHLTTGQLGRYVHFMSDDITDALDATEPAEDAKPLPPDNTQQTVATLKAKSKAARLNADKATSDIPLANSVKESLPHALPSDQAADVISTFAKEPSPVAPVDVADRALVSLGSNVIRFPARRAA